ncbi:MAG: hypothetical protein K6U00_01215 [Armatimonadetes bacterium]|nr:hypothetical protein [Armatimonadota bacterium]
MTASPSIPALKEEVRPIGRSIYTRGGWKPGGKIHPTENSSGGVLLFRRAREHCDVDLAAPTGMIITRRRNVTQPISPAVDSPYRSVVQLGCRT